MISVEDISFAYRDEGGAQRLVLQGISTQIQPGESLAIMGANGSGKSTFVKCLNGLLVPYAGRVLVDGLDTASDEHLAAIRRRVGMIFQNPDNQIVSATVEREIAFGLENLGLPCEEMHARVEEMLQRFDLVPLRRKSPHYLSGGEKQRLALAAVLAMRPQYVILDEPTSLLDPQHRSDILEILRDWHRHEKIATLLVTQFADEAVHAQRLMIFHKGAIHIQGAPEAVFEQVQELERIGLEAPIAIFVKQLLGKH